VVARIRPQDGLAADPREAGTGAPGTGVAGTGALGTAVLGTAVLGTAVLGTAVLGTAVARTEVVRTGTACSAGSRAAASAGLLERTGSAATTDVTTSQVGPHQSASTSQTGASGWDVLAGMGQQSTPERPVSTEMLSCIPGTTVRNGN
jgi:hypothetical protein